MKHEVLVELLLGEKVFALNGQPIGRLEDIRTEVNRGHYFVSEFLVGSYAALQRLAAWLSTPESDVRRAIVQSLFFMGGEKQLRDLAQKEKDPGLKDEIEQKLERLRE